MCGCVFLRHIFLQGLKRFSHMLHDTFSDIFVISVFSFLMWIFDRYSPYSYQNNRDKYKDDDEKREFTLKECLWFCMTSLTPQGGGKCYIYMLSFL